MSTILTIRHLSGSLAGKSQRVALQDGQVLRLGRAAENDIRFSDTDDDSVSGVHAELSLEGQRLFVEDKRSSNGTFLNGAPCPPFQKVAVPDGSRLRLAGKGPEMQLVAEPARTAAGAGAATAAGVAATAAETATRPRKNPVGQETLLREIDRARQEERDHLHGQIRSTRRSHATLLAAGLAGVLLLGAGGFGGYAWWNDRETKAREAAAAQEQREHAERTANPWPDVERNVSPAVVHITVAYSIRLPNGNELYFPTSTGSGVQIRPGLILTARHVAEPWRFVFKGPHSSAGVFDPNDPKTWNWDEMVEKLQVTATYHQLEVQFPGRQPLKANLASGTGQRTEDLALLQIQSTTAPAVGIGPTNSDVRVTDEIAIIGYPGELGQYTIPVSNATFAGDRIARLTEVVPTFMKGTVAQPLTGTGESSHHLFFDASIEPGNSGGPVVNNRGELVGIVSMQFNRPGEPIQVQGKMVPTLEPMEAGSMAVSPDDIHSFLRKHGII